VLFKAVSKSNQTKSSIDVWTLMIVKEVRSLRTEIAGRIYAKIGEK
jgi:hypothetical protein